MGVIKNGANGGFSGKAGSMVGSSWKSINYIKGLSKDRTKPSSQLQLEQQGKFAKAVKFLKPIKDMLNVTYGGIKQGKATGFNMALRQVLKEAVVGTYPVYSIDYSAVVLAEGSLAIAQGSVVAEAGATLHVSWSPETNPNNADAEDMVRLLIYDPQTNIFSGGSEPNTRADGESMVSLRPQMVGRTLHVYYFFTSKNGKKISPSLYAGEVEVIV